MAFNPSIDVNSWKTIQWSQDVPKLDTQLTELMLKLSTWCTNAGAVLAAPAASVADSAIASVISQRTRGYNSIQNCNFEIDQRNVHATVSNAANGQFICDRWIWGQTGTMKVNVLSQAITGGVPFPDSTGFIVSQNALTIQLATAEASLAAGDYGWFYQIVEGPMWRELSSGVTSLGLLVKCTVPLKFTVSLRDIVTTKCWLHLCTIPVANVWTYIPIPNIPAFPAGNFTFAPGAVAYWLGISLGAGATQTGSVADTWGGSFISVTGADNFFNNPITTTQFFCAFVQHEPGNICTAPIDKPFSGANGNLEECQRYFCKSYDYGTAPGTNVVGGSIQYNDANGACVAYVPFPKRMAKSPAGLTSYSYLGGGGNQVYDQNGATNRTVTGISGLNSSGFSGLIVTGAVISAGNYCIGQYTADTGW